MKNNISYYRHEVNSHEHWKFKTLRRKYKWDGEGKFWALNNMIAESENCILDLSDNDKLTAIATELDFDSKDFIEFIDYLVHTCKLVTIPNGNEDFPNGKKITTSMVQEILGGLSEVRDYDRKRKSEWKRLDSERKITDSERKQEIPIRKNNRVKKSKEDNSKENVSEENSGTHTQEGKKLNGAFDWKECTRQLAISDTYKPTLFKKYSWVCAVWLDEMNRFVLHIESGGVKKLPTTEKETIARYEKFLLNSYSNPKNAKD